MRSQRSFALAVAGLGAALIGRAVARRNRALDFDGKVVVITGGSRGLGLVLARAFAHEGARLAIIAEHEEPLGRALTELSASGAEVQAIACDVRDREAVQAAIETIVARFGRIDVLVNNAGVIQVGPLANLAYADLQRAMDVHYWGAVHMTMAALPHMKGHTRIVNIASIGGKVPVPHLAPYTASKFALVGFSETLRAELLPDGVRVTTVAPGLMRTGSPRNISVKGNHDAEYGWFVTLGSLPLFSIGAERAARQIVEAARYGDPSLTITCLAKAAVAMEGLAPGMVARANSVLNRLVLPAPAGLEGNTEQRGHESRPSSLPRVVTALTDRAAVRNNEM
jgi:NAD(P)-dependent dehydrogenase (short-subunit alcohol dehydrogenase family)